VGFQSTPGVLLASDATTLRGHGLPQYAAATAIEVRDIRGIAELRAVQDLQRRAWGITEDGYVVPVATLAGAQKVDGLVLGAFEGGTLVGFSFAFLGRLRGQLLLYSQLSGVDPACQGRGVGQQLKLAQRRRAAEMGLELVAWAYDPLQAGNAHFNLAVLGATARTYEVDLYGSRTDALNAGLATDRLIVEWPTRGEPRGRRERRPEAVDLLRSEPAAGGLRRPAGLNDPAGAASLQVEIPASIRDVLAAGGDLARDWQAAVRQSFQTAFAAGYQAVGFIRGERPCYLLERVP
jgi:predicted GNAT superfamily acetyltransferase